MEQSGWPTRTTDGRLMSDNRLAGADFVRALACTMVVGSHVAQRISPDGLPAWGKTAQLLWMIGNVRVAPSSSYRASAGGGRSGSRSMRGRRCRRFALTPCDRRRRILPGFYLALTVTFVLSFTCSTGSSMDPAAALHRRAAAPSLISTG